MANEPRSRQIGNYVLGKCIGKGTFGKVKLGTHVVTDEKVAIKILEKDRISDAADVERVAREIHVLKLLRHPNIIQMYEIIETPKQLYLIMEYASGGELFDYIVANTRLNEIEACKFYQQIISGLEYLHKLRVVHRDLKPENLLLDSENNIKIVDFGLSNIYKPDELLNTACGSPCYAAPEMIARKPYVPSCVDIWSSGVILFAMVAGYLPFEDSNTAQLYKKILGRDFKTPKFLSKEVTDLINRILDTEPASRYTAENIRNHPWTKQVSQDLSIGNFLGYDRVNVNYRVLQRLEQYGVDPILTEKCLEACKYNNETAT